MKANLDELLRLIRKHESAHDYDAIWGGISKADYPRKSLTKMTIGEVLAWQESIDKKYNSEAAGAYQFLEDTLRDIYEKAGFTANTPFDKATQDSLAEFLLRRRKLTDYLAGIISAEHFANNIAKEWASFPVVTGPNKGRSYYAGDGLNAAHAKVDEVLSAIRSINYAKEEEGMFGTKNPLKSKTIWGAAMAAMGGGGLVAPALMLLFQVWGYDVSSEAATEILQGLEQLVTVGGGVLAAIGRVTAKQTIGR